MYLKLLLIVVCLGLSNSSAASTDLIEPLHTSEIVLEFSQLIKNSRIDHELFQRLKGLVYRLQTHVYGLVDNGSLQEGIDDFLSACEIISPVWDNAQEVQKSEINSIEATLELIADYINLHQ